jgi:zinc transporter ZupT
MAASFYSSPLIGATTTLACFAHEIPHEIADYSILVRSGFSKRQAMLSQFLTAIGAFVCDISASATHADRIHLPRRIVPMLMPPVLVKGRVSRFIRFGMNLVGNAAFE